MNLGLDALKDLEELIQKNWNRVQVMRVKEFLGHILESETLFTKVTRIGESVEVPIKDFLTRISKDLASDFRKDVDFIRIEMRLEEERHSSASFIRLSNFTVQILRMISLVFEFIYDKTQICDYKLVLSIKEVYDHVNSKSFIENMISIWCLNSSIVFNQLSSKCRSVILTSGTLSPLQTFAGVRLI